MFWLTAALFPLASAAEPSVAFRGSIQSDLRFRLFADQDAKGPWYAPPDAPPDIIRNQNTFNMNVRAKSGDYRGVVDLDFVLMGYPGEFTNLSDLSQRQIVEPHRIETRALYFEARDLFAKGLDVRVGQQIVQFGVGDQFNPTNTFNANDVEDVLLFGDQMANMMMRADYALGNWTATGVLIPVFKPSLLPQTAGLALTAIPRLPFYEDELRWRVHSESALGESLNYPTVIGDVIIKTPEASAENMQFGFALGGFVGMQDIAFTYYNGFADIPGATQTHTEQIIGQQCRDEAGNTCIDGVLSNTVTLEYPAIQVFGFNMAGEADALGWMHKSITPLGYRVEAAVVVPEQQRITLTQGDIVLGIAQPGGEYEYELPGGKRPIVLANTPYAKWVLGLDYTFGKHVYLNGQWVHGMLDELGAGDNLFQQGTVVRDGGVVKDSPIGTCAIGRDGEQCAFEVLRARQSDLAVIGFDYRFAGRAGLLRLFTITDLTGIQKEQYNENKGRRVRQSFGPFTSEGFSAILYPELSYNFGDGLTLAGGALLQLGKTYTKFGDPANGGSFVFTRMKYAF